MTRQTLLAGKILCSVVNIIAKQTATLIYILNSTSNWVILKITAYSLNDQFKELVEQTLTEQKIQSETAEVIKVSVKT